MNGNVSNEMRARTVIEQATEAGLTLGTAESCTGGLISAALTSIPGSSAAVMGGVASYAVSVKESILGVDPQLIADRGVVSEEVAYAMAEGARRVLSCDIAVSTTGIAGPQGAEPGKPVGTVCLAVAAPGFSRTLTTHTTGSRTDVREAAVAYALDLIAEAISKFSSRD